MDFTSYKKDLIKESLLDMTHIIIIQLQKGKQALLKEDIELAIEVLENLKRIKLLKLKLDYDCRNFLALYTPVAVDLRFILSALKISRSLEQMAKNLEKICKALKKEGLKVDPQLLGVFRLALMFDTAIQMLNILQEAMAEENTDTASEIFSKDVILNAENRKADGAAIQWLEKDASVTAVLLTVLNVVHRVERIGDEAKNIGESIIFHLEAKVLRHSSY